MSAQPLQIETVTPLPERIAVGGGAALYVDGRCSHRSGPIRELFIRIRSAEPPASGGGQERALGWGMRPPSNLDASDYWWAVITLPPVRTEQEMTVELRARLRDGSMATGVLGCVELSPTHDLTELGLTSPADGINAPAASGAPARTLVAVCMATYNPQPDLFVRQVESIRRQTHEDWMCVISDGGSTDDAIGMITETIRGDDRFRLSAQGQRLGVYENFERALLMVPAHASYVALCDQDDHWHADKLEELLTSMGSGARLVYSDAQVVDRGGVVIDESLWRAGRIDHESFGSLMLTTAGNIPGASMLFDASLLDDVLPFPPAYRGMYHDFWIARVALALGEVGYVSRPLYQYVQHEHQTLGVSSATPASGGAVDALRQRIAGIRARGIHPSWRRHLYFDDYLRVLLACRTLSVRCGARMSSDRRRVLKAASGSRRSVAWLGARALRESFGDNATRGGERKMLEGLAWRRCAEWRRRLLG